MFKIVTLGIVLISCVISPTCKAAVVPVDPKKDECCVPTTIVLAIICSTIAAWTTKEAIEPTKPFVDKVAAKLTGKKNKQSKQIKDLVDVTVKSAVVVVGLIGAFLINRHIRGQNNPIKPQVIAVKF